MKLSFNDHALKHLAATGTPDREGRLLYKKDLRSKYKDRWFRLYGNLLFYYKTNEFGLVSGSDPVGVFVLVDHEAIFEEQYVDRPFVFSITFVSHSEDGSTVKHYFSGSSRESCLAWVDAVTSVNYMGLKSRLAILRKRIELVTGSDPVLAQFEKIKQEKSANGKGSVSSSLFYTPSAVPSSQMGSMNLSSVKNGSTKNLNSSASGSNVSSIQTLPASKDSLHVSRTAPTISAVSKDSLQAIKPVPGIRLRSASPGLQVSRDKWETFN